MERAWQIQEAKNRFSELVNEALEHGPQLITRHGKETAILLSYEEYQRMQATRGPLSAFFQASPLVDEELDLARDRSGLRADVAL